MEISYSIKNIIARFNFVMGSIAFLSSVIFLTLIPILAPLIRDFALSIGYGSAKRFYFIVAYCELIFLVIGCFILIDAFLLLIAGYFIYKESEFAKNLYIIAWSLTSIIFPIGTLISIYAIWLYNIKNKLF